jgi:hypothetical protein
VWLRRTGGAGRDLVMDAAGCSEAAGCADHAGEKRRGRARSGSRRLSAPGCVRDGREEEGGAACVGWTPEEPGLTPDGGGRRGMCGADGSPAVSLPRRVREREERERSRSTGSGRF